MRKIADVMSSGCITVTPKDNIFEAAVAMRDHDIGFVPVVDGNRLVGVITDRDLVIRGYAEKHSGSTSVTEVMSDDVLTISSNLSVDEAASLMAAKQIRRLPVVDDGELKGVVSLGDLAVREIFVSEAGEALSGISEHEHRETAIH
ncbi:CBS domain-containing protein [Cohnella caldifontis]|uniref:CBS domain-containing protein n=1 Tax=Cohnella caldifontis TaxID=3027471 RepID=UPI0023EAC977|nr:CBS domain-containing protein [Cohnella sp. YIM B05605]